RGPGPPGEPGRPRGEDFVGDDAQAVRVAERAAEGQHQRRLAAADGAADAHREAAGPVVAGDRRVALVEEPGVIVVLVRVRVSDLVHVRSPTAGLKACTT